MNATIAWITSETPASRLQARTNAFYRKAQAFLRRPLGVTGAAILLGFALLALFAPLLPLQNPTAQDLSVRLTSPSAAHWFGVDLLGRDVFARVVFGTQPTFLITIFVLAVIAPLGLLLGTAAGFLGGVVDTILMRIADIFLAIPRLVLALAVAAALGAGLITAVAAVALTAWPPYARIARAETVRIRRSEFVTMSQALGASRLRILFSQILPHCIPSMIVRAALDAPSIILITAGLGFLGLSLPPPTAEWGAMVGDGRGVILESPWVSAFPGLAILVLCLGFNLVGDALRDVIDPRAE